MTRNTALNTYSTDTQANDTHRDAPALDWGAALTRLRAEYDDSYSARVAAAAAIARETDAPQALGGEAVMQPVLRYQDLDPDDAMHLITKKHGEEIATQVRDAVIAYAATLDSVGDDGDE